MTSYTIEVDWGRYLSLKVQDFCDREGVTKSALLEAVAEITGDSRNTIGKLLNEPDPPAKKKDRSRAAILAIAIGRKPEDFELSLQDVVLPFGMTLKRLRAAIRDEYAPRDSNPEPADSVYFHQNGVTYDRNAPDASAGVAA